MGEKVVTALIGSSPVWTSDLKVQATQRVGISFLILSVFSGTLTLQRSFDGVTFRDVESWAINSAAAGDGAVELTTDKPEAQTCYYRAGTVSGDYTGGSVDEVRLATN